MLCLDWTKSSAELPYLATLTKRLGELYIAFSYTDFCIVEIYHRAIALTFVVAVGVDSSEAEMSAIELVEARNTDKSRWKNKSRRRKISSIWFSKIQKTTSNLHDIYLCMRNL